MPKTNRQNDPQFKIRRNNVPLNARQTQKSKRKYKKVHPTKRWNSEQTKNYFLFVKNNMFMFESINKFKIYVNMAKQVKTRSSKQCKTHHVKMMVKYNRSLSTLIQDLQEKFIQNKREQQNKKIQKNNSLDQQQNCQILEENYNIQQNKESAQLSRENLSQIDSTQKPDFVCQKQLIFGTLDLK